VGDADTARTVSLEGARLSREAGDLFLLESMLRNLAMNAMGTGDLVSAKRWMLDALRVVRQIDHRISQYYLLTVLAWHADSSANPRLAAQLLGAAASVGTEAGAGIVGPQASVTAQTTESIIRTVGEAKFESDYNAGKRMGRERAMRLALGEPDPEDAGVATETASGTLARREVEVAHLVAEGLSNKQIGARLYISEGTVATHVRNIMNKLGVNSRAQIASWMASSAR
jgi:DNA-binding NarL/FixJ family response regulator